MLLIKKMNETAFEDSFALAKYAFRLEGSEQSRKRYKQIMSNSVTYGSFEAGKLASQVMMTPFTVRFFGQQFSMAGIGFVASDPSYRGQGNIDRLMKEMIKDCYDQGMLFSYLAPFSYPFYRRYGYELTFERIKTVVASENWQDSPKVSGYVRRKTWEEVKAIIPDLYERVMAHKNGPLIRDSWWYEYKFATKEEVDFAIYYTADGEPTGYLAYTIENGQLICQEWQYLSLEAYQGLNRYLHSHKDSTSAISYEHAFNGTSDLFVPMRPYEEQTIRPEMMVRIIDVKRFLLNYPWQKAMPDWALVIKEDAYAPWNEGIFEVRVKQGIHVEKVATTKLPQLMLSIQSLAQLFLGVVSLDALDFYGKLAIDPELKQVIKENLPDQKPILEDYF